MIWNVQTRKDISNAAHAVFTLTANAKSVIIDSDSQIYIRFDTSSDDTISLYEYPSSSFTTPVE